MRPEGKDYFLLYPVSFCHHLTGKVDALPSPRVFCGFLYFNRQFSLLCDSVQIFLCAFFFNV